MAASVELVITEIEESSIGCSPEDQQQQERVGKKHKQNGKSSCLTSSDGNNSIERAEPLPKRRRKTDEMEAIIKRLLLPPENLKAVIKNGIRHTAPYWLIFQSYTKARWIGRTASEMISAEFVSLHPLYARAAIRKGRVFVNGQQLVDPDFRFRNGDRLVHLNHFHETEVPDIPIEIISDEEDFLVLNKPPGIPVHPCGKYRRHSVLELLNREYGLRYENGLRPLYRLDRNTTGLLMLAKNYNADVRFKNATQKRQLEKEYIAKVEGIFPEGELVCDAPIGILTRAMGIRCIRQDGQDALSRFRRLYADKEENISLVSCRIETGRTHQIRLHLQYLGFPIVGDYLYNDRVWGSEKGKGGLYGRTREELAEEFKDLHDKKGWIFSNDPDYEKRLREIGDDELYQPEEHDLKSLKLEELADYDPICWDCAITRKRHMTDEHWQMPLHCWKYSGHNWAFEAPLPSWAKPIETMREGRPIRNDAGVGEPELGQQKCHSISQSPR